MTKEDNINPTYYGNMPAEVRYCKLLTASEKVLYCEFAALSNQRGYAWAANTYFADLYDVEPTTVSEWINNLKRLGFISITNPKGRSRKIALLPILRKKIKDKTQPKEKAEGQPSEIPETNTTSVNTKKIDSKDATAPCDTSFNFKEYIQKLMDDSFIEVNGKRACVYPNIYFSAYYLKRKGLSFTSKKATDGAMRRHFRAGKELGEFTSDMKRVSDAFNKAENLTIKGEKVNWTLETVLKMLTS